MAVCGRCWICGCKFGCRARWSCGDCTEDQPAQVNISALVPPQKICGRCVDLIETGSLGALVEALRSAAGQETS